MKKNIKFTVFLFCFHLLLLGILVMGIEAQRGLADSPTATSAVLENSTADSVDIEIIGTDFDHFKNSGTKEAYPDDLAFIIYNGTNPLSAEIENSSTLRAVFPIETETGKSGGTLNIIVGTIMDSGNNPSGLIGISDQEITDNAEPLILDRKTVDENGNGKIDGISFILSENLNDDFEGLNVAVDGFELIEVTTGNFPDDNEFLVKVTENPDECSEEDQVGCDTNITPDTQITYNTTLGDLAFSPMNVKSDPEVVESSDGVDPLVVAVDFKTGDYLGITYNTVEITYSESITLMDDSGDRASTAELGSLKNAGILSGIGSWNNGTDMATNSDFGNTLSLSNNGTVLTVFINTEADSFFDSGSALPGSSTFNPVASEELKDLSGNSANDLVTATAVSSREWDIIPPVILNTYSCDSDNNGSIDRIQINFKEPILDSSVKVASFVADDDEQRNGHTEAPIAFNTATAGCDGNEDKTVADDDSIRLEFEDGIEGTEVAYLHHIEQSIRDHAGNLLALGDALGAGIDMAAPQITEFTYEDSDENGKIDRVLVKFSENVIKERSRLSANDLMFTNTGDFLGAEFGADFDDAFQADGMSVYVDLTDEAMVVDTFDNSASMEIASQNDFMLTDEAGNSNLILEAQSRAEYSDGAAPVIESFGYQDFDKNGKIDQFTVLFSERVLENSFLSASNLTLTNPGDFFGADFGPELNDLIISDTTWVTVSLGIEATEEDVFEDSGLLSISTQNAFALTDGVNSSSKKGAQPQADYMESYLLDLSTEDYVMGNFGDEIMVEFSDDFSQIGSLEFNDIVGHWAEPYIKEMVSRGIVSGKSPGMFSPNDLMTRAELTKVAVNAFEVELPQIVYDPPFVDVGPDIWYAPYIQAARDAGIIQGDGASFSPNQLITRAEVMKILIEAAGFPNVFENYSANYANKPGWTYVFFPDVLIGEWYARYIAYAKDYGIVSGYADGTFGPSNPITRAEISKIVMNVLDLME